MNSGIDTASLGTSGNPLRVAIVGSGPSGFYAAEALLKSLLSVRIDMLERLPVPFGLVRYGVAPDHPKLKQPTVIFDKIAQSPDFTFLGNVTVGRDVDVEQLRTTHHAILFACGAESDRRLGLPNENLAGSHTATEFVGWYNGHPEYRDRSFDLSQEVAVIIGQGNVAIDVARILAKPIDELRGTDIAEHALDALAGSRVRDIHIIGRRGPAQASFTFKELRELGDLGSCATLVSESDLHLNSASLAELEDKNNYNAAKNVEILHSWTTHCATAAGKRIWFRFLQSPVGIAGNGRLELITLERNRLVGPAFTQLAQGTGEKFDFNCGLLFRSIGYRGLPLPGVPFDPARGVFPSTAGRIDGMPGVYAAGWIKRGPSGIIGTNRADAVATVQSLLVDLPHMDSRPKSGAAGLSATLARLNSPVLSYGDWRRIDAEEQRRGAVVGKPREKIPRVSDMLALAATAPLCTATLSNSTVVRDARRQANERKVEMTKEADFDAVVIGAGLTGLYQTYRLREMGYRVLGVEASDNIGGVWHHNRYPGARIDSESEVYGYFWNEQLMQEFNWSEGFAAQPEVLRYIYRAAEIMDIRKDYLFNARVQRAVFDDESNLWTLEFQQADRAPLTARFVFSALGPLSAPQMPNVPGINTFKGESYHTAAWPRDANGLGPAKLDFSNKRVAVIGVGSTGVQVIQEMGKQAGHLTVFLRSPNWCTPLGNGPMTPKRMAYIKSHYSEFTAKCDASIAGFPHEFITKNLFDVPQAERDAKLEELYKGPGFSLWLGAFQDVLSDPAANRYVSDFVARKIRERVKDPRIAELLIPKDHGFGLKRVPLETKYYEVYNQENVSVVDLNTTPITRIAPDGVQTTDALHKFDVIIYATGFDAVKGSWNRIDIRGAGGVALKDEWAKGVKTYMGMQCPGFPNFFMLVGPQSGATFCNIPRCSAIAVDWLSEMMVHAKSAGIQRIEPETAAAENWTLYCSKLMSKLLLGQTNSWFTGINKNIVGRDKREVLLFVGGNPKFRQYCDDVREHDYKGFILS